MHKMHTVIFSSIQNSIIVEYLHNHFNYPLSIAKWKSQLINFSIINIKSFVRSENLILSVADIFYTEGYQEAGYEYIIIDDCWSEKQRDMNGRLVADKRRFPRGMKFIGDYVSNYSVNVQLLC